MPSKALVYLKLLTDVTGYLSEDLILSDEGDIIINNLSKITGSLQTFVDVKFNRDIRGAFWFVYRTIEEWSVLQTPAESTAFWFVYRTIEGHSAYSDESDAIQIMTVHQSKGLEFPVVIIPSLKKDNFPMKYIDPNPDNGWIFGQPVYYTPDDCLNYPKFDKEFGPELSHNMEEERVIYVAMTRAEDTLILSSLVEDMNQSNQIAIEHSEFERLPKGPDCIENAINENLDKCKLIDPEDMDINVVYCRKDEEDDEYCVDLSFTALENYNNCPFRYKTS